MMDAGAYRDRVTIQVRETTSGVLGRTVSLPWTDQETRWCIRAPVSTQHQMLLAQRGHTGRIQKLVFRGELTIAMDNTRFVLGDGNYIPIEPPQTEPRGRNTVVLVKLETQRGAA